GVNIEHLDAPAREAGQPVEDGIAASGIAAVIVPGWQQHGQITSCGVAKRITLQHTAMYRYHLDPDALTFGSYLLIPRTHNGYPPCCCEWDIITGLGRA